MDISDDITPVYVPDHEDDDYDSDCTFDDTDSSANTMSTLTSGEVAEYFQSVHGYTYTSDENIPLFFPFVPESARLSAIFHTIIRLSQDGQNVPIEARQLLRAGGVNESSLGQGPRVLDLITDCGTWVQEMAEEYPNVTFISIDVKPLRPFNPHPRITFEVYDLYAGIAEPDASFDLVHAKHSVPAMKNYHFFLREMHRVLKPGGILVLTELPTQAYEWSDPSKILESAPRRAYGLRLFRSVLESQGIDLNLWEDLSTRLDPSHPLWNEHTVDPVVGIVETRSKSAGLRGFRSIRQRTRLIPSGPWLNNETQRTIGGLARYLFTNTWTALVPLMVMKGMPETEAQALVDGVLEEFMNDELKACMKSKRWCAKKI